MATRTKPKLSLAAMGGLISLSEGARRVGVSDRTLRRRIAEGAVNAVRVGPRLVMIDPAELDKLLSPVGGGA